MIRAERHITASQRVIPRGDGEAWKLVVQSCRRVGMQKYSGFRSHWFTGRLAMGNVSDDSQLFDLGLCW